MIPSAFVARWLVVVGMSCLTVLGAAPRLDCLCPNRSCQLVCEQPLTAVPAAAVECAEQRPCCCRHQPAAPQSDQDPACRSSGCHCQMQVVLTEMTPAVRTEGKQPLLPTGWLSGDTQLSLSGQAEPSRELGHFTDLPPDDPVSHAQILRL